MKKGHMVILCKMVLQPCIANYSINVLNKVFEDCLMSQRLWPVRTPDLDPCEQSVVK